MKTELANSYCIGLKSRLANRPRDRVPPPSQIGTCAFSLLFYIPLKWSDISLSSSIDPLFHFSTIQDLALTWFAASSFTRTFHRDILTDRHSRGICSCVVVVTRAQL